MAVQILTYGGKVLTTQVTTDGVTTTKALTAGTIPTDASDWVESEYALSNNADYGAVLHQQRLKRYMITVQFRRTVSATGGDEAVFSYLSAGVPSGTTMTALFNSIVSTFRAAVGANNMIMCTGAVYPTGLTATMYPLATCAYVSNTSTLEFYGLHQNGIPSATLSLSASSLSEDSDVLAVWSYAITLN